MFVDDSHNIPTCRDWILSMVLLEKQSPLEYRTLFYLGTKWTELCILENHWFPFPNSAGFLVTMSKFLIYHFLYLLNYNLVVSRKDLKRTPKKCHICYLARQTNHCHLAWFVPRTSRPLYKPRWLSLYRSLSEMHYFAVKIWHFGSFFIFLF
jgi:hypothetical protein